MYDVNYSKLIDMITMTRVILVSRSWWKREGCSVSPVPGGIPEHILTHGPGNAFRMLNGLVLH